MIQLTTMELLIFQRRSDTGGKELNDVTRAYLQGS
jgi:hypothetical protein